MQQGSKPPNWQSNKAGYEEQTNQVDLACKEAYFAAHFYFTKIALHIIEHNARICGWFGAQRKTSPTTCACYGFFCKKQLTFPY
jgi:hypothetical protein